MSAPTPPAPHLYRRLLEHALAEDLGRAGDLTSDAVVPAGETARAEIVARTEGRIAGLPMAAATFRLLDPEMRIEQVSAEGSDAPAGRTLLHLEGNGRAILTGERTALNLLGGLSGIATATRAFVRAVEGTATRIADTRKTPPGLRTLAKYAVRCGGGVNHRFGLDDAVLIKDNHIAMGGGLTAAVTRARAAVGHLVKIQVEVDTLEQLDEALTLPVDAVLLDNMDPDTLRRAVATVDGRVITEASGGITLENVRAVAETGVDLISVGHLTHSAPSLDVALEVATGG